MIKIEEIRQLIERLKPGFQAEDDTELIKSGMLDSMSVMLLAVSLGEQFDVKVSPLELKEENFHSLQAICDFVNRLLE